MYIALATTLNAVTINQVPQKQTASLSTKYGTVYKEEDIRKLVGEYATKYNVDPIKMLETIRCESKFNNIQSQIISNGVREDSWGIVQINLYWNKVTREQALNPYFAVEWMAKEFSKGNADKWTCHRMLK